jgi:hypothetical protein
VEGAAAESGEQAEAGDEVGVFVRVDGEVELHAKKEEQLQVVEFGNFETADLGPEV